MIVDLQVAAREFRASMHAPSQAVGVLGWGVDGEPRIRVFADEEWLRLGAQIPQQYAGYRIEVQVRSSAQAYSGASSERPRHTAGQITLCGESERLANDLAGIQRLAYDDNDVAPLHYTAGTRPRAQQESIYSGCLFPE
jgi:hypothetical protein